MDILIFLKEKKKDTLISIVPNVQQLLLRKQSLCVSFFPNRCCPQKTKALWKTLEDNDNNSSVTHHFMLFVCLRRFLIGNCSDHPVTFHFLKVGGENFPRFSSYSKKLTEINLGGAEWEGWNFWSATNTWFKTMLCGNEK